MSTITHRTPPLADSEIQGKFRVFVVGAAMFAIGLLLGSVEWTNGPGSGATAPATQPGTPQGGIETYEDWRGNSMTVKPVNPVN